MKRFVLNLIIIFSCLSSMAQGIKNEQSGQLSGWGLYNVDGKQGQLGERLVYTADWSKTRKDSSLIDAEFATNLFGSTDSSGFNGNLKPYRGWIRYSTKKMELRLGLQKINFGSASILRPLMWFDRMDKRDPLQLADGVYGLLYRYYFKNNANLWLWGLLGNKETKGLEFLPTEQWNPEFGGRLQMPLPKGEFAITLHEREVKNASATTNLPFFQEHREYRLGLDGKVDVGIGLWAESSLQYGEKGALANAAGFEDWEWYATLGADYTLPIGSGIIITLEGFNYRNMQKFFSGSNQNLTLAALMATYPLSMSDNISLINYYSAQSSYYMAYVMYNHSWDKFSLYGIAFYNPKAINLGTISSQSTLYNGSGIQVMGVWYF